jgi:Raf kinase inhibitor-like YbhB/YbcL family protein
MKRRVFLALKRKYFSLLGLFLVACNSLPSDSTLGSAKKMILESPAFAADGFIPAQYTCDGNNISPPLSWSEPPADTQSLALICDDPDAPAKTWVHWVLYNLPPQTRSLPEKLPAGHPVLSGGLQGINDFGNVAYGGPCPPSGIHRYFFKLYALDRVIALNAGATKAQLEAAMKGRILAQAQLIGRYRRQR